MDFVLLRIITIQLLTISLHLKTIRQNLNGIKEIIIGSNTEPIKYSDDYTVFPNRVIINYYDNSAGGEPLITADTDLKTLKVRLNGFMQ